MGITKISSKRSWTATWTPGVNLVNFYNLYDSRGDVTISAPTSIQTTLDGPIQVARYGALTVNAALTALQRCRGLIVLSDSLSVGAAGSISMTARGAAGSSKWVANKDIFVPQSITFTGKNTSYADFLKWIRQTGYCIFDPTLYACPPPGMGDVTCDWATWTPYGSTIISATGCGAAQLGFTTANSAGVVGNAGTLAPGGGGTGSTSSYRSVSAPGRVWGGGPGSGCVATRTVDEMPDIWGGHGGQGTYSGGAGNPSGNNVDTSKGTGGCLFAFVRYDVVLTAGHLFTAGGMPGENGAGGGGGSGGGRAALYHSGSMTGSPNMSAAGGLTTGGNYPGGAGGAGSTTVSTFAAMGWTA